MRSRAPRLPRWGLSLALVFSHALPAPSLGATPADEARSAANAAVDAALAGFRTAEKEARTAFSVDMGTSEAAIGPAPDPLAVAPAIAAPIETFQRALVEALDAALDEAAAAHGEAMTAFSAATGGTEPFPRDLLLGGGGAADRLRDRLRVGAAKSIAKARKRLVKTTALLRTAGLRATFRLEAPRTTHEQGPNPAGTIPLGVPPLTIDILIGLSLADQPDGVVFAGGQCEATLGTVDLDVDGSDSSSGQATPDAAAQRWGATIGALEFLDGGGEVVVARQGGGGPAVTAAIGVP